MMSLLLVSLLAAQNVTAQGTDWEKVRAKLIERIESSDLGDRTRALQETISTNDFRAFEILREAMNWAEKNKKAAKEAVDPLKKELNQLRDDYSKTKTERDNLVTKRRLSSQESQRLSDLNQSLGNMSNNIEGKKREVEQNKAALANLEQMHANSKEGFAAIMRNAPEALFEHFRKALAKALGYPGDLSTAVIYVETLVKSGKKEAYPHLENLLKEAKGSEALFKAAAAGMAQTGGKQAIPSLINFLAFPNESVRTAAHEALKAATQQSLPLDQSAWQKWWNDRK